MTLLYDLLRWLVQFFRNVLTYVCDGMRRLYYWPYLIFVVIGNCVAYVFSWISGGVFHWVGQKIGAFIQSLDLATPTSLAISDFSKFVVDCLALDDLASLVVAYFGILFLCHSLFFSAFLIKQVMRIIP